jgi:heme exporter protein C
MQQDMPSPNRARPVFASVLIGSLFAASMIAIQLAPTEQTMGQTQRVMYVHVAVAWFSLLAFVAMSGFSLAYLVRRNLAWDQWSLATCEVGWLCATLTLITGSLWAHAAWGTWWTWDPRLVTSFLLWALYSGHLILRSGIEDLHQRARFCAVFAIVGVVDVPLVVMATRWFRGMHPVSPDMEASMRFALLMSVLGISAVMTLLLVRRRQQLHLETRINQLRLLTEEI